MLWYQTTQISVAYKSKGLFFYAHYHELAESLLHVFTLGSKLKEKIHETTRLIAKAKILAHALAPKPSAQKWQTSFILTFH